MVSCHQRRGTGRDRGHRAAPAGTTIAGKRYTRHNMHPCPGALDEQSRQAERAGKASTRPPRTSSSGAFSAPHAPDRHPLRRIFLNSSQARRNTERDVRSSVTRIRNADYLRSLRSAGKRCRGARSAGYACTLLRYAWAGPPNQADGGAGQALAPRRAISYPATPGTAAGTPDFGQARAIQPSAAVTPSPGLAGGWMTPTGHGAQCIMAGATEPRFMPGTRGGCGSPRKAAAPRLRRPAGRSAARPARPAAAP